MPYEAWNELSKNMEEIRLKGLFGTWKPFKKKKEADCSASF